MLVYTTLYMNCCRYFGHSSFMVTGNNRTLDDGLILTNPTQTCYSYPNSLFRLPHYKSTKALSIKFSLYANFSNILCKLYFFFFFKQSDCMSGFDRQLFRGGKLIGIKNTPWCININVFRYCSKTPFVIFKIQRRYIL